MTDDRLEQIKVRRAKADPDAWRYDVGPASRRINRVGLTDAAFIVNAADDVDWLVAQVERLRGLLAKLEWSSMDAAMVTLCPACGGAHSDGHFEDCELVHLLRKVAT